MVDKIREYKRRGY